VVAQNVKCAPLDGVCVTDLNAFPKLKALAYEILRHHVTGACMFKLLQKHSAGGGGMYSREQTGEGKGQVESNPASA
jgi:hypothetical protein